MGMSFENYLTGRIKFGLITENCVLGTDGIAVYRSPNPMVKTLFPNDFYYVRNGGCHMNDSMSKCIKCNDMAEFWDKAVTQKALLWALRGLGSEMYSMASSIWDDLSMVFSVKINDKITESDAKIYADYVRLRVGYNPFM
jgi:hypothetical protein